MPIRIPRPGVHTLLFTLATACPAFAQASPAGPAVYDPIQPVNRKIYAFNSLLDRVVLKPVARTYVFVVPRSGRRGIGNVLDNLGTPEVFVNDALQLNLARAGVSLGRFGLNSTVGLAGVFDVAAQLGMPRHSGDFGQTLGRWGAPPGAAVQLPVLGPSNVRDTVGRVAGAFLDPLSYFRGAAVDDLRIAKGVGGVVDGRARLLPLTDRIDAEASDKYLALRDLSARQRARLVQEARTGVLTNRTDRLPPVGGPETP